MSLVNGYRVKCSSYKRMGDREKEGKKREEKLGNWVKDKTARKAALKQLKNQLKRGESQSTISSSPSSNWSRSKERIEEEKVQGKPAMADTEKQNDEGYTKLEDIRGDFAGPEGSLDDLRDWSGKDSACCCSCSIM
eukprot:TRINITY_DN7729_c0_g1_i1.p1 TRINITY_DN7729_c0_g1~~TRINITY_DN7729_c0_g1_i1.p1  ORF type:complete len:136 (-),score=55.41 TRINITY_DN7729_c0_g1_i1:77-484(-)